MRRTITVEFTADDIRSDLTDDQIRAVLSQCLDEAWEAAHKCDGPMGEILEGWDEEKGCLSDVEE